ncbi:hypothetical protein GCM10017562_66120 [Streptomyces roseofulvus]
MTSTPLFSTTKQRQQTSTPSVLLPQWCAGEKPLDGRLRPPSRKGRAAGSTGARPERRTPYGRNGPVRLCIVHRALAKEVPAVVLAGGPRWRQ